MTDDEFWEHVYGDRPDPRWDETAYDPSPEDPLEIFGPPCPVCGAQRDACGYDAEGLPMIHAIPPAYTGDDS
jgi:hypothetical protein